MSNYQGHLADGSSIQKHSAGGLYPFVVQVRESVNGYRYELIGPGIDTALSFGSYDECIASGERLLAVRSNEDAWAFEVEQLQTASGQKLMPMQMAAEQMLGGRAPRLQSATWKRMSMVQRVSALLHLGRVRSSLRAPFNMAGKPHFAALADHLV